MHRKMPVQATIADFDKLDIRVGTITDAQAVSRGAHARPSAYGSISAPEIGIKQSSAQITVHYKTDQLIGRQVCAVVNFPPRQIGPVSPAKCSRSACPTRTAKSSSSNPISNCPTAAASSRIRRRMSAPEARLARHHPFASVNYATVTWDQLHRDARSLAAMLMKRKTLSRHRRHHPRRPHSGGHRRARAGMQADRKRLCRFLRAEVGHRLATAQGAEASRRPPATARISSSSTTWSIAASPRNSSAPCCRAPASPASTPSPRAADGRFLRRRSAAGYLDTVPLGHGAAFRPAHRPKTLTCAKYRVGYRSCWVSCRR